MMLLVKLGYMNRTTNSYYESHIRRFDVLLQLVIYDYFVAYKLLSHFCAFTYCYI